MGKTTPTSETREKPGYYFIFDIKNKFKLDLPRNMEAQKNNIVLMVKRPKTLILSKVQISENVIEFGEKQNLKNLSHKQLEARMTKLGDPRNIKTWERQKWKVNP